MIYRISVSNIARLLSATTLSQIINVASTLVLARVYEPKVFGDYAIFFSYAVILGLIANLRLEILIAAQKSKKRALRLTHLSIFITFLTIFPLITLIGFVATFVTLPFSLSLLLLAVVLNCMNVSLYFYFNKEGLFSVMARGMLVASVTQLTCALTLSGFDLNKNKLVIAYLISQVILLIYNISNMSAAFALVAARKGYYKRLFLANIRPVSHLVPSGFMERFSNQGYLAILPLSGFMEVVPFLNMYQRLIALPNRIILKSIKDVYRFDANESFQRYGNCWQITKKYFSILSAVGLPIFGLLYFEGAFILIKLLGEKWADIGVVIPYLSWIFLFSFVCSPLSTIIIISGNTIFDLWIQILLFSGIITALYIGFVSGSLDQFLLIFTVSFMLKYFVELTLSCLIAKGVIGFKR